MTNDALTFTGFYVGQMEMSYARMLEAVAGPTDMQLCHKPAPGCNTIGWLVWHLSRFKDIHSARVTGEPQVWVADGWAARFGLPEDAHGNGHTPEQAAAFRAERRLLHGYAEAAHVNAVRRISGATIEQLTRTAPSTLAGRPERKAWEWLIINGVDYNEHTGQIAYLRGMLSGPGWMKPFSDNVAKPGS